MNEPTTSSRLVLAAPELKIEIFARGYACWTGTRAQLEAEGLSPKGCDWPSGGACASWTDRGMRYRVFRVRPAGHKGPHRSWQDADSWRLYCEPQPVPGRTMDGGLWLAEKSLERERFRRSAAGRELRERCLVARSDAAFRSFITALMPARGRPVRKALAKGGAA